MSDTVYANDISVAGDFDVTYIVNATKQKLTRRCTSAYEAYKFVNKLRYSKKCTLVSYPNFS